ncbi:8-amino-7-oxononanoate synthase [Rhodomicrobium vannielii ATCC 17100]|uniref:8-amino-7-oxononanoate synthase n=2 Tax=Rhodomicrobium TaxID=1068 RepID=E3I3J3_RHOVT|nr:8-amino-7-oxononanoate synthase [Rhodomicrobium vannielii]ADP72641.1 8-amino-7-oxononanoate synthase [Rhodomicrobium vannielii ATCC 17100]
MLRPYEDALARLEERGRLRQLTLPSGYDFTSNDYLGLAESHELREAVLAALERGIAIGAGGSRLLRGNYSEHESLEADAAKFFGAESALFFSNGFQANYAIFAALPKRGDLVVYDALIHASAHDGMRAGKAETVKAAHNDANAVEDRIRAWRAAGGKGRAWIAVESLYSMDGDRAPLDDLAAVADRNEGMLVIDEAHATGVFGPDGSGLGAHLEGSANVVSLHTCGKALGSAGALVCLPRTFRNYLVNCSRPFIFSTAPSPLIAAAVRAALRLCKEEPERREKLANLIAFANAAIKERCGIEGSGSQIVPVVVGADTRATALAAAMRGYGYDIRAIRPPTVPEKTARLRISLTLNTSEATVSDMLDALAHELPRTGE